MLGLVHVYRAEGGYKGFAHLLPTTVTGVRILNPTKLDCAIVGFFLTMFALFYLTRLGLFGIAISKLMISLVGWAVPVVFLLRAIGDFKFVGIFKKIKTSTLARLDTKIYSPLCLKISISGIIIQIAGT